MGLQISDFGPKFLGQEVCLSTYIILNKFLFCKNEYVFYFYVLKVQTNEAKIVENVRICE